MPIFFKTTPGSRGRGRHSHIVYWKEEQTFDEEMGQPVPGGVTSTDKKHYHEVVINPDTGAPDVLAAGVDEHTHDLIEMEEIDTRDAAKEQEKDIVSDVIRLFKEAKNIESDSRDDAEESEEFYRGEQWTTEQINKLESEHRSYLTFNHIQANVKLLSGYQRQNRTDLRFFPIEDGDARVADVLNIITKVILDNNGFDVEETLCFEDVLISGRGFIELLVDYSENYNGDIIVEHFPWADVYMGPHMRPDAKDCEYMVKAKWFSKAKVKQAWPDKADDIQTEWDFYADPERKTQLEIPGENYVHSDNIEPRSGGLLPDGELMDIAKKNIRVLECWRKEFRRIFILANPEDDFFHSAEGWSDEDVKKAKTIPGFFAIPKHTHAMRKTTLAARTMLDDDYPDVSFNDFSLIPIYADKKGPHFWGKVEVGKDPQRETNKRMSQMIDILNKVAAYGWFIDDETFSDPVEEKNFRATSSQPGFVAKVASTERPPSMVEGVRFPTELANYVNIAMAHMREIMNINPELLGINSKAESGIAIAEKKRQGLIGNEYLFDNLSNAKRTLGKRLVAMIQQVYSPDRIVRIIMNKAMREQVEVGGQQAPEEGTPEAQVFYGTIMELLQTEDLTKFDVAIGESAHNPTTKHSNFVIWAEMAGKGIPVPPELLIELSDLPDKEKVKAAMQQMQEAQAEAESKKYKVELMKAGIDPNMAE